MRLSKIGKLLKEGRSTITLVNDSEMQQWVCLRDAAYAAEPGLGLTQGNILTVCDIEKEKQKKYVAFEDGLIEDERFSIYMRDGEDENRLRVVALFDHTMVLADREGNVLGINATLLRPIESDNGLAFYLREDKHGIQPPLVAAFDDILCGALIVPIAPEQLMKLQDLCRDVAAREPIIPPEEAEEDGQMSLLEDGEN